MIVFFFIGNKKIRAKTFEYNIWSKDFRKNPIALFMQRKHSLNYFHRYILDKSLVCIAQTADKMETVLT